MALNRASRFKGGGYSISTLSVLLLAAVAGKGARDDPVLMILLILGALTSIAGMVLRWHSHRIEQREKSRMKARMQADR